MYSELSQTKKCSTCKAEKMLTEFTPRKERSGKYDSRCKPCQAQRGLSYHRRNRDLVLPKMRQRALERYAQDPREAKYWGRVNKPHIKRATPIWADLKAIKEFYFNCPNGMTVDHIIPLRGKNVCGLHVLNNLQYLTASDNSKKYNNVLEDLEARDKEP
jgi:5-methylcytosine-specific restriction endonuclease McrA